MAYGYYDDRPRYTSLMDMIDGGGAGRSGDRFEGGGLLSLLANELFRPAGYEDRLRQRKNDTGRAVATVVDELMRERAAMKEMERQRGLQQDRLDPRGPNQMPPMAPPTAAPLRQPATGMTYPSPTARIVPEVAVPVEPAPMRQPATGMTYNLMEGQEFADFMRLQRELEQEMGFEPQSVDDIYNMFKTWQSRGY